MIKVHRPYSTLRTLQYNSADNTFLLTSVCHAERVTMDGEADSWEIAVR